MSSLRHFKAPVRLGERRRYNTIRRVGRLVRGVHPGALVVVAGLAAMAYLLRPGMRYGGHVTRLADRVGNWRDSGCKGSETGRCATVCSCPR